MFEEMASQIRQGASEGQKIAMFHLLVLKHADELTASDPTEFCRRVGVPESFTTEFRKMLALRRLMRDQRIGLTFL